MFWKPDLIKPDPVAWSSPMLLDKKPFDDGLSLNPAESGPQSSLVHETGWLYGKMFIFF
jgi:hypothetical protein